MAWSAVASAVTTIGKLLADEAVYLWGVEKQIDRLQTELKWMRSSLMVADVKQHTDERIRLWVAEIRELAYDAEDVIEDFALRVGSKNNGGVSGCIKISACFLRVGWELHETRSKIEKILGRILDLVRRLQAYDVKGLKDGEGSSSLSVRRELRRPHPHIIDQNIVGLNGGIDELVQVLVEKGTHTQCRVVSIWGMGGLGKTTLAKKLYHDSRVTTHFKHLALVFVSQQFQTRKVWEDILSGFKNLDDNVRMKNDGQLESELRDLLTAKKCLVILDDIWSTEAWDRLKPAFPAASNNVATSSKEATPMEECSAKISNQCASEDVGISEQEVKDLSMDVQAESGAGNSDRPMLRGECSKNAIANDVIEDKEPIMVSKNSKTDDRVDAKKKDMGKEIVKDCAGLPLAIVVLGGILATKSSLKEWEMVVQNVKPYLNRSKGPTTMEVLELSYDDLPAYLRPCFLYLSHYPEDYMIEAQRLIELWVAEGIVSSKEEGDGEWEVAEDVAEHYLMELAERCMIQVRDRDVATLKVKTFQMHDLMRDLCMSMAKKENFIFIVDESNAGSSSTMRKIRRISAQKFFKTQRIECPNLRSLSFFNTKYSLREIFEEGTSVYDTGPLTRLPCFQNELDAYIRFLKARGIWVYIFTNLKLLRVLNCERVYEYAGCKLIGDIGNLIHLRFLSLRLVIFKGSKLPSSLGNLRCLRTLDLRMNQFDPIHVPDVIWGMEQLRHLYLPEKCDEKTKVKLGTLRSLLTLVNFNTKNCYLKDLSNMTNLRELVIYGTFKIQGFNEEELNENPPIIQAKYLRSLTIIGEEEIDPRHLNHLLSSCSSICNLTLSAKISKLPELLELRYQFSNLAYIKLAHFKLEEDPMATLEQVPNLRVLELYIGAFLGKKIFCSAHGFPKLESLSIKHIKQLEQWKVDEGAILCLGKLEIHGCPHLDMGPVRQRFNKILKEGAD
ncbi:hypothetical protein V6N13_014250 [Hibiscus sabdariffa]